MVPDETGVLPYAQVRFLSEQTAFRFLVGLADVMADSAGERQAKAGERMKQIHFCLRLWRSPSEGGFLTASIVMGAAAPMAGSRPPPVLSMHHLAFMMRSSIMRRPSTPITDLG